LVIAVVVSDVGLLILLALIVFFGRRRSWFASRDFLANYIGVTLRARERLGDQGNYTRNQGDQDPFLRPDGHASSKEDSHIDVMSDRTQDTRGVNLGQRDIKLAQLE
jgi:hypothetical protein